MKPAADAELWPSYPGGRSSFQLARDLHADEHDVVLIGSVNDAYSQIRRVTPDLIVVYLSCNDVEGCRLLSMLALDRDTSRVPVVTYISGESPMTIQARS